VVIVVFADIVKIIVLATSPDTLYIGKKRGGKGKGGVRQ
jgi:hypothetical protein